MDRLQKVIAQAGVASRRKAETLITEGRVKVNGTTEKKLGTKVTQKDRIEVDGVQIEREAPVYFLLYKPSGVISSVSDDKGRKVVTDFLGRIEMRVYPVGRLDFETSGAILITNDGEFANKLMHPKSQIDKEYIAKVKGIPSREELTKLRHGIVLEDGKTAPANVKLISADNSRGTSLISLTIHEGRNRQVRRMFSALGYEVIKLKRERYAFLDLRGMNPGDVRELRPHEVKHLHSLAVT